jgi:hypothetical protein
VSRSTSVLSSRKWLQSGTSSISTVPVERPNPATFRPLGPMHVPHGSFSRPLRHVGRSGSFFAACSLILVVALWGSPLSGQAPGHTPGEWRSLEVGTFLFHYPTFLEPWTLHVARQILDVEDRVSALVGHRPRQRIQVIVDDPAGVSNGMAGPGPILYLWPTPPGPRSMIGETRGWGEVLTVHEYAHVAHLNRQSRNPIRAWLLQNAPLPLTPLLLGTPTWVSEGYATWIEGVVTGAGRPNGVSRPALLRTWALEGQIPTYADLNGGTGFLGGAYPYLLGSAFLEWLVTEEGRGADAFQDLWARMSAVQIRGFEEAFEGVFGSRADVLYGRFTVDLMARALAARQHALATGGIREGILVQQHIGSVGDPAVSPDGVHMAYTRRADGGTPELVVVRTTPDTIPTEERDEQARMLERDPEDVAAIVRHPRRQEAVATLAPRFGVPFRLPRWMPDGSGVLVIGDVEAPNGRSSPEVFFWGWESGRLYPVTSGQGIQEIDPAPDGRWGAGIRCEGGRCDLVRVDLHSGAVTLLAEGGLDTPYSRPRVSPDGTFIVVEQPEGARWGLVVLDADGRNGRRLGPNDGASRFDATFVPGSSHLVVVSTAGGLLNLERLDLSAPASAPPATLTRSLGSTMAPAAAPDGSIYFLSFTPRGIDILHLGAGGGTVGAPEAVSPLVLPDGLFPMASPGRFEAPELALNPVPASRPYGLGTLNGSYLPMASWGPDGGAWGGVFQQVDPIGRLTLQVRGSLGAAPLWRGGAASAHLRLGGPTLLVEGFLVDRAVDESAAGTTDGLGLVGGDLRGDLRADRRAELRGGLVAATFSPFTWSHERRARPAEPSASHRSDPDRFGAIVFELGASVQEFAGSGGPLTWATGTWHFARARSTRKDQSLHTQLKSRVVSDARAPERATRWQLHGETAFRSGPATFSLHASRAQVTGGGGGQQTAVGGLPSLILDPRAEPEVLSVPALPSRTLEGRRVDMLGVSFGAQGIEAFADAIRADQGRWLRITGLRMRQTMAPMPFVRIPTLELDQGVAWVIEPGADEGQFRGWAAFRIRP